MAGILAITEALLLDPGTCRVIEGGTIVIEDGIMRAIETGKVPVGTTQVINARGRTIMPGLIDAHVHLASFADTHDEEIAGVTQDTIARSTLRGVATGLKILRAGITTVRDCSCKHKGIFHLRDAFASGLLAGPRLVVCGSGPTMTGGIAHNSSATEADGADNVRHVVRTALKYGADFVKIFASPGLLHPVSAKLGLQYTEEEMRAAVDEAHRVGKKASVHATVGEASDVSVKVGVNSLEHGHVISEETAQLMAKQGCYMVPTLWHYKRAKVFGTKGGFKPEVVDNVNRVCNEHAESFIRVMNAGAPIAAGTDAAGGPGHPAPDLSRELMCMEELGMTRMDVLRSTTSAASRLLDLDKKIGRLEVGYAADLAGFSANPLNGLKTLENPWLVVKAGSVVLHQDV